MAGLTPKEDTPEEDTPLLSGVDQQIPDHDPFADVDLGVNVANGGGDRGDNAGGINRWSFFYFFCFLSGQYINVYFTKKKVVSVAGVILFVIQFLLYLGHVGTAVTVEVCRIGTRNSTFTDNCTTSCPTNGTGNICSMASCTNNCSTSCMIHDYYTTTCIINCSLPQEHWKFSTAITIGSIASFLSYGLITCWILIPLNGILCYIRHTGNENGDDDANEDDDSNRNDEICTAHRKALKYGALSPFDDSDDSSKLSAVQTLYFYINYLFVHILFIFCFVFSVGYAALVYQKNHNLEPCWNNKLNVTKITLHLISQFCSKLPFKAASYFSFNYIVEVCLGKFVKRRTGDVICGFKS